MGDHARTDVWSLDLAQLEGERIANMLSLDWRLAEIKLPCLAIVVCEAFRSQLSLRSVLLCGKALKAAVRIFSRPAFRAPAVRLIVGAAFGVDERHVPVLLEGGEWATRGI